MNDAPLDLSQLAIDRSGKPGSVRLKPRRRRWAIRYALPIGIVLCFAVLLAAAAGRRLLPRHDVTVIPVIVKRAEGLPVGATLFQSPGWIEPRPTAISVAALAPGVIEELLVVEGQRVTKGEPIARLISIDAELDVEHAENLLAIREGELNRAKAELDAARIRLEKPLQLQVQLADAESLLARAQTELAKLPFLIEAAEANVEYTLGSMEGKRLAKGSVAGRVIALSESQHVVSKAELNELRNRSPNLQSEVDALTDKVDALKQQLVLRVEETRQVREAEAKVQSAEALRNEGKLLLRQAELALDRNVVRAPMDGRVMRLVASPGTRLMGLASTGGHGSGTVIEMYDPSRMQARADVRLEDVPLVSRGQRVKIETASSSGIIEGRVLQMTSSANVQKNTLEVKIELIDPPSTVSPEMLVTASFLAADGNPASDEMVKTERLFVPRQLVRSDLTGSAIWIADADELAQLRPVELGSPSDDGLVEIRSGLNVTDKLIASGFEQLHAGRPLHVIGDDQTIGFDQ